MKRKLFILISLIAVLLIGGYYCLLPHNAIIGITLTSPHNNAIQEAVDVSLEKPASIYITYWEKNSPQKYRTIPTVADTTHRVHLLLLKANHEYEYQVTIDGIVSRSTSVMSFKTREQSPWLISKWFNEERPHDASALGDGMILLCFARTPGYMAMIDGEGQVRWYWQVDDLGVRVANLTPRGTLITMLRPAQRDVIDDAPQTHEAIASEEIKKPMRRGALGFAGGTAIAEIDLTGEQMWRVDLNKKHEEKEFRIIHHEIMMDKNNHIYTLNRPQKIMDLKEIGKMGIDTLGGDGIAVFDTLGNVVKHWSAWDVWDVKNDPCMERYMYDRFHMNGMCFDTDGNYLLSVPIEDQIWKVNAQTGALMWKLGRGGDFAMDTTAYFSFQHTPYINNRGEVSLFDNGLYDKKSRALSFKLDETAKTAQTTINTSLPQEKYTSRMGSAYLMPNGNLLQTSSKTGSVMITNQQGEICWEIVLAYAPYRAIYIPAETWKNYFTPVN